MENIRSAFSDLVNIAIAKGNACIIESHPLKVRYNHILIPNMIHSGTSPFPTIHTSSFAQNYSFQSSAIIWMKEHIQNMPICITSLIHTYPLLNYLHLQIGIKIIESALLLYRPIIIGS